MKKGSASAVMTCEIQQKIPLFNPFSGGQYPPKYPLFDELKIAKADGSYIKEIGKIESQDLLIIDDFGLKPLDNLHRLILLEILEDRHGKRSTLITSQLPVNKWYDIIGDPTIADAILDRLVHSSHRIELDGDTMRKKYKND